MINFDVQGLERLKASIAGTTRKFEREMVTVVNQVARKTKSSIAKQVGKTITLSQKKIKRLISTPKMAANGSVSATVRIKGTARINVSHFRARQNKKGVSTKIYRNQSPQVDPGAFKVNRWNGRVMKRVGKRRGPIKPVKGPAVVEVFAESIQRDMTAETQAELNKQLNERIRFLLLKQSGAI